MLVIPFAQESVVALEACVDAHVVALGLDDLDLVRVLVEFGECAGVDYEFGFGFAGW